MSGSVNVAPWQRRGEVGDACIVPGTCPPARRRSGKRNYFLVHIDLVVVDLYDIPD
jgi:hypothetical protein